MKSPKETALDRKILKEINGKCRRTVEYMINDPEIKHLQDYANTVSIKRLHYNDHGPVHMRMVALNAVHMAVLLREKGIAFSLENEGCGSFDDSLTAILIAAFLHDIGMSIGRHDHEKNSVVLAAPIIDRILRHIYGNNIERIIILRSLALECISGHMGTQKIHSLEAGLLLIADGLDMEKGRARIPMMIDSGAQVGDIHKYSAAAIEMVTIEEGRQKPLKIIVEMSESIGLFQIEEVLFAKINSSPMKQYIELYATIADQKPKRYL
ncbi:MAG: HD domain-containing protein [Spirochaetales bacterium]|uniref:HD domain-containing protein n=1 Tax=Candidatus Thalassospirochaeta sargassi TaxID=3119039 RepID=A0AAJ1IF89_9SPIO|nr:HD domain-containing protein [Spirochaetales bacterium]